MKQNVNPAVALVAILSTVGIAGFLLWYANRERPRPTHYGLPPGLQKMEDARASSFLHPRVMPGKTKSKPGQKAATGDGKDTKDSTESKVGKDSKPADSK